MKATFVVNTIGSVIVQSTDGGNIQLILEDDYFSNRKASVVCTKEEALSLFRGLIYEIESWKA